MAALAAGAAAAGAQPNVTSAVRRVLLQNGNKAMRLTSLFDAVKPEHPDMSRTHFRERVVRQMFQRGEVVKYLIEEEVRGKQRRVYGMRLKVNRDNRHKAEELGLVLSTDGKPAAAFVAPASPEAQQPQELR